MRPEAAASCGLSGWGRPLGAPGDGAPGRQDHPDAHHPSRLPSAPCSGTQQEWRMVRVGAWLPCSGAWPGAPGAFLSPQKELRQPRLRSAAPGPTPGGGGGSGSARLCVRPLWHRTGQRRQGHALQRRLLEHQLLTAVSPWVGKVILPRTPRRPAVAHSRGTARGPLPFGSLPWGPGVESVGEGGWRGPAGTWTSQLPCRGGGRGRVPSAQCRPRGVFGFASPVLLSTGWPVQEVTRHSGLSGSIFSGF